MGTGVEARDWHEGSGGVTVETDRGNFHADKLVVTPGPWAADLLHIPSIPLTVLRKSLFWFRPPAGSGGAFAAAPPTGFPCFAFDTAAGFYYGFPALDGDGVKIAEHTGGHGVADPLALDRSLDAAEAQRVTAVAGARLPGLGTTLARHAACLYTMTPDSHFLIGLHPDSARVAIAAGFSGHGFKFASVVGEILADLVVSGTSALPIGFLSPQRFPPR